MRNDYGDIRGRNAGDGKILVSGVLQRLGSDPDVGVNVERHGDSLAITVVAPPGRIAVGAVEVPKDAVDRADLVVYVPEGVVFGATTLRGMVEARRFKAPVDAWTRSGDVRVETTGWVRARSATGNLLINLIALAADPSVLETGEGNIWLSVPAGSDYGLSVRAGGKVKSEIELRAHEQAGRPPLFTAEGGRKTTPVVARSDSGDVEILARRVSPVE